MSIFASSTLPAIRPPTTATSEDRPEIVAQPGGLFRPGSVRVRGEFAAPEALEAPTFEEERRRARQLTEEALAREAPTVEAQQLGEAAQARAAEIARIAPVAGAQIAAPDQAALAASQQARAAFGEQLQARAAGTAGPSAAERLLQQALEQNIAALRAQAAAQAGANPALVARQLQQQQATLGQQAGQQAAILRAQEEERAQTALGQFLGQQEQAALAQRAQDIGLAQAQAGLQQQAALSGQQLEAQRAAQQAQLAQQAGLSNVEAQRQFALQQAAFGQQANLANLQAAQQQAALNQQLQQFGLGQEFGLAQQAGALGLQEAQQARQLQAQQNQALLQAQLQAGLATATPQQVSASNLLSAGASGLGAILAFASDERLKTNVKSGEKAGKEVDEFLDHIAAKRFDYKDPRHGPRRFGVMAQDAAKTEVGRTFVKEALEGHLEIDIPSSVSAILAGQARLNQRLRKLEKRA